MTLREKINIWINLIGITIIQVTVCIIKAKNFPTVSWWIAFIPTLAIIALVLIIGIYHAAFTSKN
jgi:L-asparagine transporter-like permease